MQLIAIIISEETSWMVEDEISQKLIGFINSFRITAIILAFF